MSALDAAAAAAAAAAIAARVSAAIPGVTLGASDNRQPHLLVAPCDLLRVAALLRDDAALRFDSLMDVTGWDLLKYPGTPPSDAIAVAYYLHSFAHRHRVQVRVLAPRAACAVPSVGGVWPAAIYFEREVFDLLGVTFTGHPDLRRIMCPDDWVGHPLRKDYAYPADYHGVAHLRDGQRFEEAPQRAAGQAP
jgi:NADH-quinone oxidoreductase subunit C